MSLRADLPAGGGAKPKARLRRTEGTTLACNPLYPLRLLHRQLAVCND
ncbi:MAG TPA: hypothetical protein VGD14_24940 [bacterium]